MNNVIAAGRFHHSYPEAVTTEIKLPQVWYSISRSESSLGRRGASFPTDRKWSQVAADRLRENSMSVIATGDEEGEPKEFSIDGSLPWKRNFEYHPQDEI